ncbi:hypothetical protein K438DRAFT_1766763 [Mycena galopus ATCC 62051]|nr:hypothetical protein K438DRAFT_1766763 [Mycena galopus ATCC 62051]
MKSVQARSPGIELFHKCPNRVRSGTAYRNGKCGRASNGVKTAADDLIIYYEPLGNEVYRSDIAGIKTSVLRLRRENATCGGDPLFGIWTLKWNEIIRNNARIPHEASLAQWVNFSGPRSPPMVPGPEDVSVVEKDLRDFGILRFESCEMVNNVPDRSGYGKEKANQSDDIDASKGVQETHVRGPVSLTGDLEKGVRLARLEPSRRASRPQPRSGLLPRIALAFLNSQSSAETSDIDQSLSELKLHKIRDGHEWMNDRRVKLPQGIHAAGILNFERSPKEGYSVVLKLHVNTLPNYAGGTVGTLNRLQSYSPELSSIEGESSRGTRRYSHRRWTECQPARRPLPASAKNWVRGKLSLAKVVARGRGRRQTKKDQVLSGDTGRAGLSTMVKRNRNRKIEGGRCQRCGKQEGLGKGHPAFKPIALYKTNLRFAPIS